MRKIFGGAKVRRISGSLAIGALLLVPPSLTIINDECLTYYVGYQHEVLGGLLIIRGNYQINRYVQYK